MMHPLSSPPPELQALAAAQLQHPPSRTYLCGGMHHLNQWIMHVQAMQQIVELNIVNDASERRPQWNEFSTQLGRVAGMIEAVAVAYASEQPALAEVLQTIAGKGLRPWEDVFPMLAPALAERSKLTRQALTEFCAFWHSFHRFLYSCALTKNG